MTRETFKLDAENAQDILWGCDENFEIISDEITDSGRWDIYHYLVIKRLSDGKFFADSYSVGATEYQDTRPFEDGATFTEVFPVEKTIIVYE